MQVNHNILQVNNNQNIHLTKDEYVESNVDKIKLLPIVSPYSNLETPELNIYGKKIHLYPTESVQKAFNIMKQQGAHGPEKMAALNKFFAMNILKVSDDTTLYYSEDEIQKLNSTIKDGAIYRNGTRLNDDRYIFIINQKDQLIIDRKRITQNGRIQHSSLANGKEVKAAGTLEVTTDKISGIQKLCFKNMSGHYQPTPESLNHVVTRFSNSNFKLAQDETIKAKFGLLRTLELSALPVT